MPIPDKVKLWKKLEETGETEVRRRLSSGAYGKWKIPLVEEWLRTRENVGFDSYAFISYQTDDKKIAGKIKNILADVGIESFLAHEDITVSEEWRLKILEEIGKAGIFICLLSKSFTDSAWCVQESGIAAFRDGMTVIPFSIDENFKDKTLGFISNIQFKKIEPATVTIKDLFPGLIKHDPRKGIEIIIEIIGKSVSFRNAEANFRLILPYISKMTDDQIILLFESVISNSQVHHASECVLKHIPSLLNSHGHLLSKENQEFLNNILSQYH